MSDDKKSWIDNTPKDTWGSMKNNPKNPEWKSAGKTPTEKEQSNIDAVRDILNKKKGL
jgi:hypothetical protein